MYWMCMYDPTTVITQRYSHIFHSKIKTQCIIFVSTDITYASTLYTTRYEERRSKTQIGISRLDISSSFYYIIIEVRVCMNYYPTMFYIDIITVHITHTLCLSDLDFCQRLGALVVTVAGKFGAWRLLPTCERPGVKIPSEPNNISRPFEMCPAASPQLFIVCCVSTPKMKIPWNILSHSRR